MPPRSATSPGMAALRARARACGKLLMRSGARLATAESCTGGLLAATCTEIAGSSDWFECAFVTYRVSAKTRVLGVAAPTLARWGAVSEPTARAMAEGALAACDAQIAVSVTGVAGPGGGDIEHPVGTVWFAWAVRDGAGAQTVASARHQLAGTRNQIRRSAVGIAIDGVIATLSA
jgi:nicotinamide-nucleotide amidase